MKPIVFRSEVTMRNGYKAVPGGLPLPSLSLQFPFTFPYQIPP